MKTSTPPPQTWHTPGQWKATKVSPESNVGYRYHIGAQYGWDVAAVANQEDDSECEANARLIVAAPDLLGACKSLVSALPLSVFESIRHTDADRYWKLADALDVARAAIAKAGAA